MHIPPPPPLQFHTSPTYCIHTCPHSSFSQALTLPCLPFNPSPLSLEYLRCLYYKTADQGSCKLSENQFEKYIDNLKKGKQLQVIIYNIIKQDIRIYMLPSRSNGSTDQTEICFGHSWVAGGCYRLNFFQFFQRATPGLSASNE